MEAFGFPAIMDSRSPRANRGDGFKEPALLSAWCDVGPTDGPSPRAGLPSPVTMVVDLPANSRITVRPADLIGLAGGFSAIVESDVPTVVERVTYTTVNGVLWTAGTCALATRFQSADK